MAFCDKVLQFCSRASSGMRVGSPKDCIYVRMLQKFPDIRHWLHSKDKGLLHFIKEPSFSSFALCHAVKLLVPLLSPRWFWYVSNSSRERSTCFFGTLKQDTLQLFIFGNRKQSQEGRSDEYIRWVRELLHLALIEKVDHCCYCVRAGIFTKKKKATESRLWTVLAPNFEDLWVTVMHTPVGSDRLSSRGMVATWLDFWKKQATIFFYALRDLLSFGGGVWFGNSEAADCILVCRLYRLIQVS